MTSREVIDIMLDYMLKNNLSQYSMAEKARMSKSYISAILNGRAEMMSPTAAGKILKACEFKGETNLTKFEVVKTKRGGSFQKEWYFVNPKLCKKCAFGRQSTGSYQTGYCRRLEMTGERKTDHTADWNFCPYYEVKHGTKNDN